MPASKTNGKTASKDEQGFYSEIVEVRGKSYTFRELSAGDYNDLLDLYTKDDSTDNVGMTRAMAIKSIISPTLTVEEMMALPFPVYSKLIGTVNRLHWGPDETELPNA